MSEQRWTKEPWRHIDRFGFQGADLSRVDLLDPNNGDRVEACVNALTGIPDPSAHLSRVAAMEEALRFYADESNYSERYAGGMKSVVQKDAGELARMALGRALAKQALEGAGE